MTIEFLANRVEVIAGTAVGQDWKDTFHDDAAIYVLTEVTATPGFECIWHFNRFRVSTEFANTFKLEVVGYYEGNPAHDVKIYIYNWVTGAWDAFTSEDGDFESRADETTYTFYKDFGVGMQEFLNGPVLIKIKHDSNGAAGHHLHINRMLLSGVVIGNIDGAGQL